MTELSRLPETALALVLFGLVSTSLLLWFKVRAPWATVTAVLRATLQLAALSLILTGIITSPFWIGVALFVMFSIATSVATRRAGFRPGTLAMMTISIGTGSLLTCTIVFATGSLEFSPRYVLAVGAMVVGNAMAVGTLTTRNFTRLANDHWDQVEGWLALGATPRQSTLEVARKSVYEALIPHVDQAKTTGLVVLPGAFVGAVFGGLSPLEAGRFQLIILAGLLASGAITAVIIALWQGAMRKRPLLTQ